LTGLTNDPDCFTTNIHRVKTEVDGYRTNVVSWTNQVSGVVTSRANIVHFETCLVTHTTNIVPCPPVCIKSLAIDFGRVVSKLNFDTNDACRDQVYVVTNGVLGTVAPAKITLDDGKLVLKFSPPLCPGDASFPVGLLSRNAPRDVLAKLKLTEGETLRVGARAPLKPIDCDFSKLEEQIKDLKLRDLVGPDYATRELRRAALLELVEAAEDAAKAGNAVEVTAALAAILEQTDGVGDDWLTPRAAREVNKLIADIAECLAEDQDHCDGDKDEDDR
jgi:hypothetical protein